MCTYCIYIAGNTVSIGFAIISAHVDCWVCVYVYSCVCVRVCVYVNVYTYMYIQIALQSTHLHVWAFSYWLSLARS